MADADKDLGAQQELSAGWMWVARVRGFVFITLYAADGRCDAEGTHRQPAADVHVAVDIPSQNRATSM